MVWDSGRRSGWVRWRGSGQGEESRREARRPFGATVLGDFIKVEDIVPEIVPVVGTIMGAPAFPRGSATYVGGPDVPVCGGGATAFALLRPGPPLME